MIICTIVEKLLIVQKKITKFTQEIGELRATVLQK